MMLNELSLRVYNYLLYTLDVQLTTFRKDRIAQQRWSFYFLLDCHLDPVANKPYL